MARKEEIKYSELSSPASDVPSTLPVIPLRDVVIFPSVVYPVLIGREASLRAASGAWESHKIVFLATQKNAAVEDPGPEQIHPEGCVARIMQLAKLPNGLMRVVVDGLFRGTGQSVIPAFGQAVIDGDALALDPAQLA